MQRLPRFSFGTPFWSQGPHTPKREAGPKPAPKLMCGGQVMPSLVGAITFAGGSDMTPVIRAEATVRQIERDVM